MTQHPVVSRDEWLVARQALLTREKALTRARDELARARRALPWVRIEKAYVFEGPGGRETLADLFAGRSQLIVKHFMLAPGQLDPCVGCSFESDHIDGALVHLENHDVSYVAVARAPYPEIEAVKRRMGWRFRWVSCFGGDFNHDFGAAFTAEERARGDAVYNYRKGPVPMADLSGFSVFLRDADGTVLHTYSAYGRGAEEVLGTYMLLDLTPLGRNETGPNGDLTDWVRHRDRYGAGGSVDATGRYRADAALAPAGGCCG